MSSDSQKLLVNGDDDPLTHDVGDDNGVAIGGTAAANVDDGGSGGKAFRLYQAAFDRAPDLAGLDYWIAQVDAGAKLSDIATGFIESAEFKALYGANPTNEEYTQALYRNVLDREPDSAGYAYWSEILGSGATTREQMLVDFSESAENKANVIALIGNGVDHAPLG
jgi:hypothetical protein